MKRVLTIAGSDSSAGAGIQADLKTFAALGVYGMSVVTAITAQNTTGVTAVLPLPTDIVVAQLEAVVSDIGVDAAKTGMLATTAIVEAVVAAIDELEIARVVVDPVMTSTAGARLLDLDAVTALKVELLRRALVVTPNTAEAEILAGVPVSSISAAREAARRIHGLGPAAVIVKGGHLAGPESVDLLFDGRTFFELRAPRVAVRHTHGTGCTFSAALAASLALGFPVHEAAHQAKQYVTEAIQHGLGLGRGAGPFDHFWNCARKATPS